MILVGKVMTANQGRDNTQNMEKIRNAKLNNNRILTFAFLINNFHSMLTSFYLKSMKIE